MTDYLYIIEPLLFVSIVAVYVSYFYAVYKFKTRSRKSVLISFAVSLALGIVISFLDKKHIFELEIPAAIIMPVIIFMIFDISFLESLKLFWFSFFGISLLTSAMENFCLTVVDREIIQEKSMLLIVYISVIILIWLLYGISMRGIGKNVFKPYGKIWIPLLLLSAFTVFMISNYQYLLKYLVEINRVAKIGSVLAGIGGVSFTFIFHILLYYINSSRDYCANLELSRSFNEQQKSYFTELLKREEETRRFRHDYYAEQMIIRSYTEKGEYEKLKAYLSQVEDRLTLTKKVYSVGNEIIDVILKYYLPDLSDKTVITVMGTVNETNLSEADLTVIVSNLLRNAVEELKTMETDTFFLFECRQIEGELIIRTKNSVSEETYFNLKKKGLKGSNKGKGHFGFGIANIIDIIELYGGSFDWNVSREAFAIEIRFFD